MLSGAVRLPFFLPIFTHLVQRMACSGVSEPHSYYEVKPAPLGVEVFGIDLKQDTPQPVIDQIKRDVHKYRIMIFRNQGEITGKRHVEISKWFGKLESTFYKHHRSPHPDVFRVSNDESEGCTGVGRTGWHIDGSFQPAPFAYALYHMAHVPTKGDTAFAPLRELIEGLPQEQRDKWERLWMVSDARVGRVHPLIYSHPITGDKTLCFHLGMIEAFVWDFESDNPRVTEWPETASILKEIHHEFVKNDGAIQYSHKWQVGDFIISDNLSVGHEATPESQLPRSQVGLRVLHRTTIQGHRPPKKEYTVNTASATGKQEL